MEFSPKHSVLTNQTKEKENKQKWEAKKELSPICGLIVFSPLLASPLLYLRTRLHIAVQAVLFLSLFLAPFVIKDLVILARARFHMILCNHWVRVAILTLVFFLLKNLGSCLLLSLMYFFVVQSLLIWPLPLVKYMREKVSSTLKNVLKKELCTSLDS